MSSEKKARNLFKGLGSSPYLLPLLKYIAAACPAYSDIESYFRTVRRLYGYSHGLPTSKVIATNLRTLVKYSLVEKHDRRWKITAKGRLILDFEKTFEEPEQTVYFWIGGLTRFSTNQAFSKISSFLSQWHDFQDLSSLDAERKLTLQALVRPNPGYTESIALRQDQVLCGLMYELDEARLSNISRDSMVLAEAQKYSGMLDFLYVHLTARLQHPVADFEHACLASGSGSTHWDKVIGIANCKTRDVRFYDVQSRSLSSLTDAQTDKAFSRLAALRALDHACDELSNPTAKATVSRAMANMSDEILLLERELAELEFTGFETEQGAIRSLQLIKDKLLGLSISSKSLDEAIRNIKAYAERKGLSADRRQNLLSVLVTVGIPS